MGSDFNLIKGKHSCTLSPSTGPLCSYFHAISDEFPTVILLIKAKSRLVVFMGLSTKTLTHFGQNLAFSWSLFFGMFRLILAHFQCRV